MIPFLKNKRNVDYLGCLAAVALGAVIYSNSFKVPFHFDDNLTIIENNLIKSLNNPALLWRFDPSRFFTYFSFAVNYYYGKLNTAGYHAVNLALHLGVTALVYFFIRLLVNLHRSLSDTRERRWVPLLTALIFVSHPLQTQAVTYISQRSTLLAALSYFGTVILYFFYRRDKKKEYYLGAAGVFFLGLFTKPIIVTLPLALVLLEVFFKKEFSDDADSLKWIKGIGKRVLPFLLMALSVPALLAMWKYSAADWEHYIAMTRETRKFTRYEYLLTQFNVLMTYVRLLFVPYGQNLDYDYPIARSFFIFPTWLSFFGVMSLVILAVRQFRKNPLISFGIFWMFVTLSLESSLFPISDVINEHRLYLPMAGFGLAVTAALIRLFHSRTILVSVFGIVIAVFSVLSYIRNEAWGDKPAFWQDIARKSPNKARVHNNLGIIYADAGRVDEALAEYRKAVELDGNYAHPHNNLANIYFKQDRFAEAREELAQALAVDPDYPGGYYNLGNVAWAEEKFDEAAEHYAAAIRLRPSFVPAMVALGKCYRRKGDIAKGEFYFRAALRIDPDYDAAYSNLGDMYLGLKRYKDALWYYQQAVQRNGTLIMAYNNMANIYDMYGAYEEAVNTYREIIVNDPTFANAYFNLANTLRKLGRRDEAKIVLNQAIERYSQAGNTKMAEAARRRLQQLGAQ